MRVSEGVRILERDLRDIFGPRLQSLVVYGPRNAVEDVTTLVIVEHVSAGDLRACADRLAAWEDAGLATPLVLAAHEFERALDAFPLEFGVILADHVLVAGPDPFDGLRVDPAHLRQACEIQARSHLLHLREGFLETRGRGDALRDLLVRSAPPLNALLQSVARMKGDNGRDPEAAASLVEQELELRAGSLTAIARLSKGQAVLSPDAARQLFPAYLEAVERLTTYIDRWGAG
jgi:hypothetical protein